MIYQRMVLALVSFLITHPLHSQPFPGVWQSRPCCLKTCLLISLDALPYPTIFHNERLVVFRDCCTSRLCDSAYGRRRVFHTFHNPHSTSFTPISTISRRLSHVRRRGALRKPWTSWGEQCATIRCGATPTSPYGSQIQEGLHNPPTYQQRADYRPG
jgi:hypothetical protein